MLDNWEYQHPYLSHFTTEPNERQKRINICKSCERLTELNFCRECNCFMPLKTWLKTKKCKIGKW